MHGQTHIRERIFYLGAVVKTESAHQLVTEALPAENFFKSAGLRIGAILDGAGLV